MKPIRYEMKTVSCKRGLSIVLCRESPYNLINVLGLLSFTYLYHNVKFIDTSSAGKTEKKSQKYFNLSVINWNLSKSNL